MAELPVPILEFGRSFILRDRSPAYLVIRKDGRLCDWGGDLAAYGIQDLTKGEKASRRLVFLEGLIPLERTPITIPCVEISSEVTVDLHIFQQDDSDWILLLDARTTANRLRGILQETRQLQSWEKASQGASGRLEILEGLLHQSGILVLEQAGSSRYRSVGRIPDWAIRLSLPAGTMERDVLSERFPFLETFLEEAETFWGNPDGERLVSGTWIETGPAGEEYCLEASALRVGRYPILIISSVGETHREKRDFLQTAREHRLSHQRLLKEIEKKEILLHCIVHDLAGPLMGIRGSISLLAREELSEKGHERLERSTKSAARLERMTKDLLDVFSADLKPFSASGGGEGIELASSCREVVGSLEPVAELQEIQLRLEVDPEALESRVVAEQSRLERVLFNLLENALRHAPRSSDVVVEVRSDGGHLLVNVKDRGEGVEADRAKTLFDRFSQGKKGGRAGLGLHFCKIMADRWGGQIGYSPRRRGGSCFWFRLPALES